MYGYTVYITRFVNDFLP